MALPKKGFRKIVVNGNEFLWKVRKKVSWNEIHNGPLDIPIQHVTGGKLLIVTKGYSRSYFEGNNEFSITPHLIEKCIKEAIKSGWNYIEKGSKYELDCTDLIKTSINPEEN